MESLGISVASFVNISRTVWSQWLVEVAGSSSSPTRCCDVGGPDLAASAAADGPLESANAR